MALPVAGTTSPEGGASLFLSPQPHLSLGPSPLPPLSLGLSPSPPLSLGSSPPFLLSLPQPLFNIQVAFPPPPPWSNGLEARASFYFYEDSLGPSPPPPLSLGMSPSPPLSLGSSPLFPLSLPQPPHNSQGALPLPPPWLNGPEAWAFFSFLRKGTSEYSFFPPLPVIFLF
ncbi:hypothetical protein GBA52_001740 [Prunus armeniaca]|nr:hypothetical protein GBA52_001740 [Prunus armeniaca]